jgi:hypothetical protein
VPNVGGKCISSLKHISVVSLNDRPYRVYPRTVLGHGHDDDDGDVERTPRQSYYDRMYASF